MTDKLKPCPFCGGEAEVSLLLGSYGVACTECMGAIFPAKGMTKEEAIEAWNTRKPMDRIVEQLEDEITPKEIVVKGGRTNGKTLRVGYNMGIVKAIEIVKVGTEQTI